MVKSNLYNRLLIVIMMFNMTLGFSQGQRSNYINSPLMQPAYLQEGDTVMIVATAGILKESSVVDDAIDVIYGLPAAVTFVYRPLTRHCRQARRRLTLFLTWHRRLALAPHLALR